METEIHGHVGQASRAGTYSNDGNVVWFDNQYHLPNLPYMEDANSAGNANSGDTAKYPLSGFQPNSGTVLLWRHAYNLYSRRIVDPKRKLVQYFRNSLPAAATDSKSTDPLTGCAFNAVEQEVFREFVGIKPPAAKPR